MSQKEKEILEKLGDSISKASESKKEYLLGLAEGMALMMDKEQTESEKE